MNLILFDTHEATQDTLVLNDRRAQHIRKVLRGKSGDTLRVGRINGPMGTGRIEQITDRQVTLRISLDTQPPPPAETDLILAVPRPIMLKRVLAQAASLGIGRIFLINANRVEKSFFNSTLVQEGSFREPLLLGLEQAIDTRLPEISVHSRFRPFIEDVFPQTMQQGATALLAHPDNAPTLPQACPPPLAGKAFIAIGPEGGWVDFEVEKFKEQGFLAFSLGPRILRVDTAVPALLAQLSLLRQIPPSSGRPE